MSVIRIYSALPLSRLVQTAKKAGCKYITLTTRHHDGFSLYDTCGLNEFDAPHSACGRDLVKEFVDECNKAGITPFFYHTLLDWWKEEYQTNFSAYIDYLVKSIEILCTNYGKIGGFWFDGMWDKPNEDWQEDRLYGTIRKYQSEAMIINNTGLSALGKVGHPEIDSVTFERGKPAFVDNSDRHRAGEMCQVLNDHWGFAREDINYKSVKELVENLVDCRKYNCNFLLNIGPRGDGSVKPLDAAVLEEIGLWVKLNKKFIYKVKSCEIQAEGADLLKGDDGYYYAVIKDVPMSADPNVTIQTQGRDIKIYARVSSARWLDTNEKIPVKKGAFAVKPFDYGRSLAVRVAKIKIKE
jgi:alpha-L-fucosidase